MNKTLSINYIKENVSKSNLSRICSIEKNRALRASARFSCEIVLQIHQKLRIKHQGKINITRID